MNCMHCGKPAIKGMCRACLNRETWALSALRTAVNDLNTAIEKVQEEGITSRVAALCDRAAGRAIRIAK